MFMAVLLDGLAASGNVGRLPHPGGGDGILAALPRAMIAGPYVVSRHP